MVTMRFGEYGVSSSGREMLMKQPDCSRISRALAPPFPITEPIWQQHHRSHASAVWVWGAGVAETCSLATSTLKIRFSPGGVACVSCRPASAADQTRLTRAIDPPQVTGSRAIAARGVRTSSLLTTV